MTLTKKLLLACLCFTGMGLLHSCKQPEKKEKWSNNDMYDISNPTIINLPAELDEISGIAYYEKDTSVFAIIDEDGFLYKIPIMRPNDIKKWRFDKQRDYEDLILKDSQFFVLVSNGNVEKLRFAGDLIEIEKYKFNDASKKANEFETLYLDTDSNKIVIVCKQCEEDKKKVVSSFVLDETQVNDTAKPFRPYKQIDV
ncbi:MAG: hypothetical protein EOO20_26230, partial [Chryseobacterium sp.]